METIAYIIGGILGLIGLYIIFRLISMAIFKSWFDAKSQNKGKEEPR